MDRQHAALLISGEHAGNDVPAWVAEHIRIGDELLASHRGWDPGSLGIARELSDALEAPLVVSTCSRLVVDLNRSVGHSQIHGAEVNGLSDSLRARILSELYLPHRESIAEKIGTAIASGRPVIHVGVHTFTRELDGDRREYAAGLLFDPDRTWERTICERWRALLAIELGDDQVRLNQPYLGTDDGLTTALRARFGDEEYAGIEIEWRNDLVRTESEQQRAGQLCATTLRRAMEDLAV